MGRAARLPGHGRGGQGRSDQARHVRHQPAGVSGLFLQGAVRGGARPRLSLAHEPRPSRTRADRHLQPLLLRGGPGGARAPRDPREAEAAERGRDQAHLGGTLRGHPGLRAVSRPAGLLDPQVLPERVEESAERALPRAPRSPGKELEVLAGRRQRARALALVPASLRGHDPRHRRAPRALVRRPRRHQVVLAPRGGGRRGPGPRPARPRLPEGGRGQEAGASGCPRVARSKGKTRAKKPPVAKAPAPAPVAEAKTAEK